MDVEEYLTAILAYCKSGSRAVLIGYSMIAILAFLAVAMTWLTVVVQRLASKQDRVMPFIFGCMAASLTIYTFYYMSAVTIEFRLDWFMSGKRSYVCTNTYFNRTASLFLEIAATLSLSKWIQFLFRI